MHRRILDDGFNHVLTVYQDKTTHGLRLHATVREGPLKRTPVWTAFSDYPQNYTTILALLYRNADLCRALKH
jgi:hypothetical protein